MNFKPRSFEQIYSDMVETTRKRVPNLTDFEVGSVIRTLYESFAYEMAMLYEQMNGCYNSAFIDTATGAQLDMLVAVLGIRRGEADFAVGEVTFERDLGTEDIEIPLGTLVTTQETEKESKKSYITMEAVKVPPTQTQVIVRVQAKERGEEQKVPAKSITVMPIPILGVKSVVNLEETKFTGKRAETDEALRQRAKTALISSGKASLTAIETTLLSLPRVESSWGVFPSIKEVKLIERFGDSSEEPAKFGVLDVYVDGIDFKDHFQVQYLRAQVDKVRAAGVYVDLKPAEVIYLDGVFKIEINPGSDRQAVEQAVQKALQDYLGNLKMGQDLLFSQLIKQVLSVPNVSNLDNFEMTAQIGQQDVSKPLKLADRQITAEKDYRKVKARQLFVAADIVPVPIRVVYQSPLLDREKKEAIDASLREYFTSLTNETNRSIRRGAIAEKINTVLGGEIEALKLDLAIGTPPKNRSPFVQQNSDEITVSFLEKVALERVFAYQKSLYLVGAIAYQPSPSLTEHQRQNLEKEIRDGIGNYIDNLLPEESVEFDKLEQAAQQAVPQKEDQYLATVEFKINNFYAVLDNQIIARINNPKTLSVLPLEKVELGNFLITNKIESVIIYVDNLSLRWRIPAPLQESFTPEKQQVAIDMIRHAINQALRKVTLPTPGKAITYQEVQSAILSPLSQPNITSLLNGVIYEIQTLILRAKSAGDGIGVEQRIEAENQSFHIRSIEQIKSIIIPDNLLLFV